MTEPQPTVFLLDDEKPIVVALARMLQASGFAVLSWTSAARFLAEHNATVPGCLVADVRMPEMNGLQLQSALAARGIERPVVFITGQADLMTAVQAMKAGAVTFLEKPIRLAELIVAVEEALARDQTQRARRREQHEVTRRLASLTPREMQVLDLVADGLLNKQIAAELGAAEKTIKVHRRRIMQKMQVRTATALVGLIVRSGARAASAAPPHAP
jgi:FixJ family two-component response regulator